MARAQKYILGSDDILDSGLVTAGNKANLVTGGLFTDLAITSGGQSSGNFTDRKLYNNSSSATLDWQALSLTGAWSVVGDLTVSGTITGSISASQVDFSSLTTDAIVEGTTNLYFTTPRFADTLETGLQAALPLEANRAGDVLTLTLSNVDGLVVTNKVLNVSKTGTDTRGTLSKYDASKPFLTIRAAAAAAAAGDLILVLPGDYTNEYDLLKTGVDYYFHPGAKITTSNDVANSTMFEDSSGPVTANVYGHGTFVNNNTFDPQLLKISNPASNVSFQADLVQSTVVNANEPAIEQLRGSLLLDCRKILSDQQAVKASNEGTLVVRNTYISSTSKSAIEVSGMDTVCFIDNCQLKTGCNTCGALYLNSAALTNGVRIKNSIFEVPHVSALTNYSISTTPGDNPSLSILPGNCANKDIHDDILVMELSPFTIDTEIQTTFT